MKKLAFIYGVPLLFVAFLPGCAQHEPMESPWQYWICANHISVLWRFADTQQETIEIYLDQRSRPYYLQHARSGSGMLYRNAELVFHSKGLEGAVYQSTDGVLLAQDCRPRPSTEQHVKNSE